MSSGEKQTAKEKLFDQFFTIGKMVVDEVRESQEVSRALQPIISKPRRVIKAVLVPIPKDDDEIRTYWEELWRNFGVKFDPAKVVIPARQGDFTRVLMMPRYLKQNTLRDICQGLFPCRFFQSDLDQNVPFHDRFPLAWSYAIRVRDRVEADEELKNLSADQLAKAEIATETLLERLVHEVDFFKTTKKHLDPMSTSTLCAGSRYASYARGKVPGADLSGGECGEFGIDCYDSDTAGDNLRARAIIF